MEGCPLPFRFRRQPYFIVSHIRKPIAKSNSFVPTNADLRVIGGLENGTVTFRAGNLFFLAPLPTGFRPVLLFGVAPPLR